MQEFNFLDIIDMELENWYFLISFYSDFYKNCEVYVCCCFSSGMAEQKFKARSATFPESEHLQKMVEPSVFSRG